MSDPFTSPADQWGLIFYNSGLYRRAHTRQEWAQIADAINLADLRHREGVRGSDAWCTTAINAYTRLRDADAYANLRTNHQLVWHADERLIRAWLGAPNIPAQSPRQTVLHDHGWNHTLDPERRLDPADLTLLVEFAQDAGVVGEPHHKAQLLRWVQDGTDLDDTFLILLWRPDGPAIPSGPVRRDDLVAHSQSATDRAVAVLTGVAAVANRLLAIAPPDRTHAPALSRERPTADTVHEQPLRHGGRAFRLITGTTDPQPPPPPPPLKPPRHPRT